MKKVASEAGLERAAQVILYAPPLSPLSRNIMPPHRSGPRMLVSPPDEQNVGVIETKKKRRDNLRNTHDHGGELVGYIYPTGC